jgi:hypothetical protein
MQRRPSNGKGKQSRRSRGACCGEVWILDMYSDVTICGAGACRSLIYRWKGRGALLVGERERECVCVWGGGGGTHSPKDLVRLLTAAPRHGSVGVGGFFFFFQRRNRRQGKGSLEYGDYKSLNTSAVCTQSSSDGQQLASSPPIRSPRLQPYVSTCEKEAKKKKKKRRGRCGGLGWAAVSDLRIAKKETREWRLFNAQRGGGRKCWRGRVGESACLVVLNKNRQRERHAALKQRTTRCRVYKKATNNKKRRLVSTSSTSEERNK